MDVLQGAIAVRHPDDDKKEFWAKTKSSPSFGCSFLRVVAIGFLACFRVVGASPASPPGASTSAKPSTSQIFYYIFGSAAIIGTIIPFIVCFRECYRRREQGDGVRGVVEVLTRPVRERRSGMYMSVDSVEMGGATVSGLIFDSRVGGIFVGDNEGVEST